MDTKLDELLGKELAEEVSAALGLSGNKDDAEAILKRMHDLEVQFVMESVYDSSGNASVSDVYHRALLLALAKLATNEMHVEELEGELSESEEAARYAVNARDSLQYEVTNLRYQVVEDIAPYRELVSRLVIYIIATPGTLDAFDPELATEVDRWLKQGDKLEAIKLARHLLHCGLKEAKDLVEARMAMHAADQAVTQAEKDTVFEKLNRTGPLKRCVKCGRFMPIDADRKILSHPNLFTGVECEGTEVGAEDADRAVGVGVPDGIEHLLIVTDKD